jgi:hypothetical protein
MRLLAAALLLAGLTGCAALLPDAHLATEDSWKSFDDAQAAIEKIVPYRTGRAELAKAGLDPKANPAITLLSFADVVQRFAVGSAIDPKTLDAGLRDCLAAGKSCTGYSLNVRTSRRNRIGNFWLDLFNFRREVDVTGWTFNALILFVEDTAVYTVHGGQPKIHELELSRNPLGPFQGFGERVAPTLLGY